MPDQKFSELVSGRLTLRRFQMSDVPAFVTYRSDPQVARYQSWDSPYLAADGERMIADLLGQHPDTAGRWFQFATVLRSTGELIGDCASRTDLDDPRQAEIGFTLAPEHQGSGYATEAAAALVGYLFSARAKHRVTACCDARNAASAAVLRRLGMRSEGHLRESTWAKGEWTDDLLFAVLDREWTADRH